MSQESSPPPAPGEPFRLSARTLMLTGALMMATIMQSLDTTIANVALPHMQSSMSAAQDQITWVLTSYLVMAGICTPLTGFLVTRFGRKRLFIVAVAGFTIASMFCGAAQSLEQIVFFRLLQGATGAFLIPLPQSIILDVYPREYHGAVLAGWSMGIMISPILGPTIGGYLTELYSWRWVFYINLPIGILSIIGAIIFLPESKRDPKAKFDLLGFALLSTAIGAFQLLLDRGTTLDWFSSTEIVIEATVAALAFYTFIAHMFTAPHPFLSRALVTDTNYIICLAVGLLVIVVAMGSTAIVPTMLQNLMGYPVLTTGTLLAPRGLGSFLVLPLVGRISRRVDARVILVTGMAIMGASMWWMSQFTLDVSPQEIVTNGLIQGIGTGLVFVPLATVTFATLDPRYRTEGASLFALMRNLSISIGVSVDVTLLARNTQVNHAELVEHITPFNHALQALAPSLSAQSVQGVMMLEREITRQAGMIAYDNLYRLSMYLVIGAALLIMLVRLPKVGVPDEPATVEV